MSICHSYGTLDNHSDGRDDMPMAGWKSPPCEGSTGDESPRGNVGRWIDKANLGQYSEQQSESGQVEERDGEVTPGRTPCTTQRKKRQARVAPPVPSWGDDGLDELETDMPTSKRVQRTFDF